MKEIRKERTITNRNLESLERYLKDIKTFPVLNVEEEIALIKKIRQGDTAASDKLVTCNLRFVVTVAKHYEMPGMSLVDLISEGNIGLLKAAKHFDETRGFKFISYAVWWIRQAILVSMSLHKRMIRLPTNQLKGISNLWYAEGVLEQRLHRSATPQELCDFMGLSRSSILDYLSNAGSTFSFDAAITDENTEARLDTMSDPATISPDATFEREALGIEIELMMSSLTARERKVLRLAYGIEGDRAMENREIGEVLGVSAETVRREKGSGFFKLRTLGNIRIMQEYT